MVLLGLLTLCGCSTELIESSIVGSWLFKLQINNEVIPFEAEIIEENGKLQFYATNGEERIRAEEFELQKDSVLIRLPIFNTALKGTLKDQSIRGNFYDYTRKEDYQIPFTATKNAESRFKLQAEPTQNVAGRWQVTFSPGSDNEYVAVGEFEQNGSRASGTFLTTTGDYRYLEGNVTGDSLLLSSFDGAHVFLFKAKISGNQIQGDFWSGNHWQENWEGVRNDSYQLPDPTSLTFLKPGYTKLQFAFEDLEGNIISLEDKQYENKVVIVQIMGSWCPNCMDETAYLVSLYNNYHQQGLEVVSLAFEKSDNEVTNIRSLKRLQEHFEIPYPILLAGKASKTEAAKKLPMLNHVLSFPTTIFIDKTGAVRRIHTGFSGPGTGEYYKEFVEETNQFVTQLLIE